MRHHFFLFVFILLIFCCSPVRSHILSQRSLCQSAKEGRDFISQLSHDSIFCNALSAIQQAGKDKHEHSITLGKTLRLKLSASPITNGDPTNGNVNSNWPGAFADIHNHTNDMPPSAGDIYNLVKLYNRNGVYRTRFVITLRATVYALYVYDADLADDFAVKFPAEQTVGFSPRFPEPIFDDVDRVSIYFEGRGEDRLIAQERALSFILSKYHCGIVLLKRDSSGNFKILVTEEAIYHNEKRYVSAVCN